VRKATTPEILDLLRTHSGELRDILGEPAAQLSLPTDGRGARVLARLPHTPDQHETTVVMVLDDQTLEIPVQLSGDYERMRATFAG
jgi:hypothetical protein